MAKKIDTSHYRKLLSEILSKIQKSQIRAFSYVNRELIKLYWDIGKLIVERQDKYGWGKSIVEKLSKDLEKNLPGTQSFSARNLWFMRQMFYEYTTVPEADKNVKQPVSEPEKLKQLVSEIPWGQNILILQKVKNLEARLYYLKATAQMRWSRNVLLNPIKANAYLRHRREIKQHNFQKALPVHMAEQAGEALKSRYNLDFLGIAKPVLEREFETRLVERIKQFILELGYGFCFIGNQYKLKLGNKEYFIDLLFYHRILKCLVAIELKATEFKPEYAGKMNFYLNILDKHVKTKDENPQ